MSLSQKVELLDRLSRGESAASVGRHFSVNESIVRCIKKNKKAMRESVAASTVTSTKVVTQAKDIHIETMEKALNVWLEDNAQKNVSLTGLLKRQSTCMIICLVQVVLQTLVMWYEWPQSLPN